MVSKEESSLLLLQIYTGKVEDPSQIISYFLARTGL